MLSILHISSQLPYIHTVTCQMKPLDCATPRKDSKTYFTFFESLEFKK